jgi:hypothetical protein
MNSSIEKIHNNLEYLYNEIPSNSIDEIKSIWKKLRESQFKLDQHLNNIKDNIHLNPIETSKTLINYNKNLKSDTKNLYNLIDVLKKVKSEKTIVILELLSDYMEKIDTEIKDWEDKLVGNLKFESSHK